MEKIQTLQTFAFQLGTEEGECTDIPFKCTDIAQCPSSTLPCFDKYNLYSQLCLPRYASYVDCVRSFVVSLICTEIHVLIRQ